MIQVVTLEEHAAVVRQLAEAKEELAMYKEEKLKQTKAERFMIAVMEAIQKLELEEDSEEQTEGVQENVKHLDESTYITSDDALEDIDFDDPRKNKAKLPIKSREELEEEISNLLTEYTNTLIEKGEVSEDEVFKIMELRDCFPDRLCRLGDIMMSLNPSIGKKIIPILRQLSNYKGFGWL